MAGFISSSTLPIITPFKDDKIDFRSYKRLIDTYVNKGISGIIPLGTTGEVPVLNDFEFEEMIEKTMALLMNPPKDFSILTGEDILFYVTLTLGGQGGILASSHLKTEQFVDVYNKVKNNELEAALQTWKKLYDFIPLLFKEPNPAPIK